MRHRKPSIPVSALACNEVDRFGLWRIASSEQDRLAFDWLAAVRHVLPTYMIGIRLLLFGVPLGLRAWIKSRPAAVWLSFVDHWLIALLLIGFVGVFLPAVVMNMWVTARELRRGSWLQVDRAHREIVVRPCDLRIPWNKVEWSVDYVEGYDEGQLSRRARVLLRFECAAGKRTLPITARYGRNALSTARQLTRQYANFTCSTVAQESAAIP